MKSSLTPILAGILAVTVVGSGVGYYFTVAKDSDSGKSDKETSETTEELTIEEAAANIEKNLDKVQQIADGELETGYKAELTYSVPDSLSTELGYDIKDMSMTMEAKQKDKLSSVDYGFTYDGTSLITANIVYDNENETAYIKIPELSDAFLTGTADEINAMLSDTVSDSVGLSADSDTSDTTVSPDADAIADIDIEALIEDIESYGDTVKENSPEPTDGENRTGEVDGISYDLTTKVYAITATDAKNILTAVSDKGKADTTLKNAMVAGGMTEDEYTEMWDSLAESVSDADESDDTTVNFEVYYSGEDVAGWSVTNPEDSSEEYYMIVAATDSNVVIDMDLSDAEEGDISTVKGAFTLNDNTMNGSVAMTTTTEDYDYDTYEYVDVTQVYTVTYDNLKAADDDLTGSVTVTSTSDGEEDFSMTFTFNNVGETLDTTVSMISAGEDLGTIKLTAQGTDASDITVPTGTAYSLTDETQLDEYLTGCDTDSWLASLETALGSDLYNALFGSTDDYSTDDYSYDYYDYDYDTYTTDVTA